MPKKAEIPRFGNGDCFFDDLTELHCGSLYGLRHTGNL